MSPLRNRHRVEIPRIIDEYVADAVKMLGAPEHSFTDDDRQWVMRHSARTLPEIAKGTLRVVTLNTSLTYRHAARRLGMASVSLVRWVRRRAPLPNALAILPARVETVASRSTGGAA